VATLKGTATILTSQAPADPALFFFLPCVAIVLSGRESGGKRPPFMSPRVDGEALRGTTSLRFVQMHEHERTSPR
jgi:hypothetical protein